MTEFFNPTDGATDVAVDSNIVLTFNENIAKNTGASKNITIKDLSKCIWNRTADYFC